jgi:hypothetical protein
VGSARFPGCSIHDPVFHIDGLIANCFASLTAGCGSQQNSQSSSDSDAEQEAANFRPITSSPQSIPGCSKPVDGVFVCAGDGIGDVIHPVSELVGDCGTNFWIGE